MGGIATIGILQYPGAQLAAVHGLMDLFGTAVRLDAERGRETPAVQALLLDASRDAPASTQPLAALILPPSLGGILPADEAQRLAPWLLQLHGAGTTLCSVCAGAFVLAETGLLDGRAATTHWALAESFAARFPRVRVDPAKLLIDGEDVITAGGVMAWIDLGPRLIDRLLGPAVMLATARMFLVDPAGREQSYYSNLAPRMAHGDSAVLRAQQWLAEHFPEHVSIPRLATHSGLGDRTFLRRFQAATGQTPSTYLQQLRVARAKELLELGDSPIDDIAWQVGYEDASAFRKIFQRIVGLAPGAYRQRFSVARGAYPALRRQSLSIATGGQKPGR
ncbi:MAG: GlxA family transcriptional regulator [Panacagrimonas sp.]